MTAAREAETSHPDYLGDEHRSEDVKGAAHAAGHARHTPKRMAAAVCERDVADRKHVFWRVSVEQPATRYSSDANDGEAT